MNLSCIIFTLVLLATASTTLHAQASDTILPNPNAVLLRKIWMVQGETTGPNAYTLVGDGAGSLADINGDSLTDFAVRYGKTGQWRFYLGKMGAPDTIPFWTYDSCSSQGVFGRPIIGDFFGNGRPLIGLSDDTCRFTITKICYFRLRLFQPRENGSIPDTALLNLLTNVQPCVDVATGDLDNDKADELVLAYYCYKPELWLYQGGAGFQVTTPTQVIREEEELRVGTEYTVRLIDVDGDRKMDMVTSGHFTSGPKLKIWYGRDGSPWNWTSTPDRVISSVAGFPWFSNGITALDCDGDSIADLLVNGNYIFRSGSGKNARTRSFSVQDADHRLVSGDFFVRFNSGSLNHPQHRYDMIALVRPGQDRFASSELRAFSGSSDGVDSSYEAYYRTDSDGLTAGNSFQHVVPLSDCNGDGWSDLLIADPKWWGFDQGIAVILAGGPYIPHDDPTVDVQELPAEGKPNAISIWPNPVRDVLNIAWHGRLQHSPARLTIHDLNGQLVASGVSDPSVGAMQWNANGVAGGTYLLTVYDREGRVIVSTGFIKQE